MIHLIFVQTQSNYILPAEILMDLHKLTAGSKHDDEALVRFIALIDPDPVTEANELILNTLLDQYFLNSLSLSLS